MTNKVFQGIKVQIDYTVKRVSDRQTDGIHRVATLLISPAELCDILGQPDYPESGDGKVVVSWTFQDQFNNVFKIYPYKATREYSENLPSIDNFLSKSVEYDFSIAATNNEAARLFVRWLHLQGYGVEEL